MCFNEFWNSQWHFEISSANFCKFRRFNKFESEFFRVFESLRFFECFFRFIEFFLEFLRVRDFESF